MNKERMAAFSDGVIAVIITIMVLELNPPHDADWDALRRVAPVFLSYVLSFVYVAIYWNNHHHMLAVTHRVNGAILWANLHLLFWLSLIPFTTTWMEVNHFAQVPTLVYGVSLLMPAIAHSVLLATLIAEHGRDGKLASAVGSDLKGKASIGLYAVAIPTALWQPAVSLAIYVLVALMWLVPDRRIERVVKS